MSKLKKKIDTKIVKSVNKNVRSSTRKLKPILKSIVGKKVNLAIRDLTFSDKRISNDVKKTISVIKTNKLHIDWLIIDHYAINETWENEIRKYVKNVWIAIIVCDKGCIG